MLQLLWMNEICVTVFVSFSCGMESMCTFNKVLETEILVHNSKIASHTWCTFRSCTRCKSSVSPLPTCTPLEHGDWLTVKIRMDPCVHQILTRPSKWHSRNRDSSDLPFYLPFLLPFSFFLNSTKRSEIFKPAHLVPTSGTTFRAT